MSVSIINLSTYDRIIQSVLPRNKLCGFLFFCSFSFQLLLPLLIMWKRFHSAQKLNRPVYAVNYFLRKIDLSSCLKLNAPKK